MVEARKVTPSVLAELGHFPPEIGSSLVAIGDAPTYVRHKYGGRERLEPLA